MHKGPHPCRCGYWGVRQSHFGLEKVNGCSCIGADTCTLSSCSHGTPSLLVARSDDVGHCLLVPFHRPLYVRKANCVKCIVQANRPMVHTCSQSLTCDSSLYSNIFRLSTEKCCSFCRRAPAHELKVIFWPELAARTGIHLMSQNIKYKSASSATAKVPNGLPYPC